MISNERTNTMTTTQKQHAREAMAAMQRWQSEGNTAGLCQAYDNWLFYSAVSEIRELWEPWMGAFPKWAGEPKAREGMRT